jgi:hypothetical protein
VYLTEPLVEVCSSQSQRHTHRAGSDTDGQKTQGACLLAHVDGVALAAGTATYLDVIHIAIVYGERDLLELRFGSISPLGLNDLIASVLYSRGNTTARSVLQLDSIRC